jgi:diadenosine tetraphosphatase ApaH/serine/threonine PP2A family protein phosphatase
VRVLLLSDIHANLEALEACLKAAPPYDAAVNLGDLVGYGASPNEVIQRVRQLCRINVRGNHDRACAGLSGIGGFNAAAAMAAHWTRQTLSPGNLEWLRQLPAGPLTAGGLAGVQFVHGSPFDEDEYLISITHALEPLLGVRVPLTFFGHTHIQGGFCLYEDQGSEIHPEIDLGDELDQSELQLNRNARYLLNPGSSGQPRDGDWRAAFAVFDSARRAVTLFRVPYDVPNAQRRILDAGLPERLATRLVLGR